MSFQENQLKSTVTSQIFLIFSETGCLIVFLAANTDDNNLRGQ